MKASTCRIFLFQILIAASITGTYDNLPAQAGVEPVEFRKNDSIAIIGNTFAERLHLFGYFETFLHSRFPDHQLRIRNLGWSADELTIMPRPRGFGDLRKQLEDQKADLVFACFGMNESFAGQTGLAPFRKDLDRFIEGLKEAKFNGASSPRLVLVSPIAHENVGGSHPDGTAHNKDLALYTAEMQKAAARHSTGFIDLFTPSAAWMRNAGGRRLTFNGIHLVEYGYWAVSQMMASALGLIGKPTPPDSSDHAASEKLRRAIYEKNYQFYFWWRAPNASYIHGGRNRSGGSRDLPRERRQQLRLIDAGDQGIWNLPKPGPQDVWKKVPVAGKPIWFPTPADVSIPEPDKEPGPEEPKSEKKGPVRTPAEALKSFQVADGYKVNLFASELDFPIANPLAMSFDARGRLWVANSPTWPHPLPGEQPGDSILILEDTDKNGIADKHSVFIDKLNMIHGFALGDGGAYISQAPNMIFARDTDGDDRSDWVRMVLHGFGTEDVEHAMNNFRWSPGGSIFFDQGIFYHTQVETPYGPSRVMDAAAFRYRPSESRLEVFLSHSFWNPYGILFDRWGRGIILDASAGQYYPMDVLSARYVYPKRKSRTNHLSFHKLGGIAAGCDYVRNRHFPPEAQGRFVVNHCVGNQGTHWQELTPTGAIYKSEQIDPSLVRSKDITFRPIAMAFGPDGALYILDFHSYIFENVHFAKRHPGRDHTHGRVWRISHKKRPLLKAPKITGQPVTELLELLKAYENSTRELARRELQERPGDTVIPMLEKWIADLDKSDPEHEHHLVEALWIRQGLSALDAALLKQILQGRAPQARMAAARVLRYWQNDIEGSIELLRKLVNDSDPRVRLEAVLACGFSASPQAQAVALEAAGHELGRGLKLALDQTMDYFERSEKKK